MPFEQIPPVTLTGNIELHGREGVTLSFGVETEGGVAWDIAAEVLFFEVEGVLRVALAAGASASERLVTITQAQVAAIAAAGGRTPPGLRFVVRDESGAVPTALWDGFILIRGFTEEPA